MMQLSVITDEISQHLEPALDVCEQAGVRTIELRAVDGLSLGSHDDERLHGIKAILDRRGFRVCAIASPFLKSHVYGDGQPSGELHAAAPVHRDEQWTVLEGALRAARVLGAPIVRAFSFWRLPNPESAGEELIRVLRDAVRRAEAAGVRLGLENEYACNIATGAEAGWVLRHLTSESFGIIWDPGNEARLGSRPFPDGYANIRGRVIHVQLKDLDSGGNWTRMGTGVIDYVGQLRALDADGYRGALSLETHYAIPNGGSAGASRESLAAIRTLCAQAGVSLG